MHPDQTESLLRGMLETIPDLVWLKDVDGVFISCNAAHARLLGVPEAEIVGKTDYDFVTAERADFYRENDRLAMAAGGPSVNEEWITFADGHRALVETVKTPMFDESDRLVGILGIARDITELRAAQEAVLEKERYLRALVDNFPFLVWLKDPEGRYLTVNRAFAAACDATDAAELEGRTDLDVFPPDLAEAYRADDRVVMETRAQKNLEEEIVDRGSRGWFETYKAPVVDDSGRLLGTVGFSRDISDRKSVEAALLRRDALLEGLARATERILAGQAVTDENITGALNELGTAAAVDRVAVFERSEGGAASQGSVFERYEWSRDGLPSRADGSGLENVAWGEAPPRWYDIFASGGHVVAKIGDLREDERALFETQGVVSVLALPIESDERLWGFIGFGMCDGERDWTASEVALLRSAAGSIGVAIGRMRTEAALRESEERYRTVAEFANDWESWSGPDGSYRYVSPSCERITGHTVAEFMSDADLSVKIAHPDDRSKVIEHFGLTGHSAEVREQDCELEYRIITPSGEIRWIHHVCTDVHGESGQWLGRRATNRDVSERVQAEEALALAAEAADFANRAKSDFLATMSHEIRTPMNAIIGMAELLDETHIDADQARYVRTLRSAGEALLTLIDDVLDLSKTEAGRLELDLAEFEIEPLLEDIVEVSAVHARAKDIELMLSIDPGLPARVVGDSHRIRQVLVNLVGNAVKFTEHGSVLVRVEPSEDTTVDAPRMRFSVVDTGIGIAADKLDSVMDPFTQADSSTTRRYGGTGLGLAISRRLVLLMGADLEITSEVGLGSTFAFDAVFAPSGEADESVRPLDLDGIGVLVMDDDETCRLIYRRQLESAGATVLEAVDDQAAVESLGDAANSCAVVLLKVRGLDAGGREVVGRILSSRLESMPAVILMSAHGQPGDSRRACDLGAKALLAKPVRRRDLIAAVLEAAGEPTGEQREGARASRPEPPASGGDVEAIRILLAEDSDDNRMLVLAYLRDTPHTVVVAKNGREAVDAYRAAGLGGFDLVLMDMQMPVMDGYDATRAIRLFEDSLGGRVHTRIVSLTAYALPQEAKAAYEAGCDEYVTKPIKKATLLEAIGRFAVPTGY